MTKQAKRRESRKKELSTGAVHSKDFLRASQRLSMMILTGDKGEDKGAAARVFVVCPSHA